MGARPTAAAISCALFSSLLIAGQAEGFSITAAKDASRFVTPSTAVPSRFEAYQPDFRGIKAAMQATNAEGQAALAKHHHQHSLHDTKHQPSPDFELQLEKLKGNHGSNDQPVKQQSNEEDPPVAPLSRKDDLFTPGLGVEEVSFLGPIRRPEGSETTDNPPPTDLLESEADVLEELRKLSGLHDAPPEREAYHSDEEEEDGGEGTTPEPEKASLEERLSASLRELAELRRRHEAPPHRTPQSAMEAPPEAPGGGDEEAAVVPEWLSEGEAGGTPGSRAAMKKAHMARKLMDPEDPKRDEDLLELMLRIAENPDEWKRVHNLLRQLDDDLTTYEKTMHRVQALAVERSAQEEQKAEGAPELSEKEARREQMSRSGLPAGSHGEATSTTTQHPPQSDGTHHKEWRPKFAYHRVTTAPLPDLFLQQHESQKEGTPPGHHHRNHAYIAVSIIAPPGRSGGKQPPQPSARSPPPSRLPEVPPATLARPPEEQEAGESQGKEAEEETLREPMVGEEEVVEAVARQATSLHERMIHADPVEEQLRALAAVEAKLRHHLHEKERMRHLLKDVGDERTQHPRRSKRSMLKTTGHQHPQDGDPIALINS